MKIGFVGLGTMGMPMAKNLRTAGHDLVVHDLVRQAVDGFVADGGRAAPVAEMAADVDVLLLSVPSPEACEQLLIGPGGALESAADGQLWIDFSSNGPDTARRIATAAREQGVGYLDAPVSGGPWGAEAGTLGIMVGGSTDDFTRAGPVFDVLGGNVRHFGPPGAGCVAKLANQIILGAINASVAEAYILAVRNGLDPKELFELLSTATAGGITHDKLITDVILPRNFTSRFSVNLLQKDLALAVQLGRQSGVRMLLTTMSDQIFQEAKAHGLGDEDMAAIFKPLEDLSGVTVKGSSAS